MKEYSIHIRKFFFNIYEKIMLSYIETKNLYSIYKRFWYKIIDSSHYLRFFCDNF